MRYERSLVANRIKHHLSVFPAAGLVGARQVGKTTLAKMLAEELPGEALYLDLQRPSSQAQLADAETFLQTMIDRLVILDEVQTMPELFPTLRNLIDEDRRAGRFLLLGSAAPELMRSTAESLAGRIAYTELTGLRLSELEIDDDLYTHWLRGGFPFAYDLPDARDRIAFYESYLQTFVATDLRDLAGGSDPTGMRRLVIMLSHLQGTTLNASHLGRSLEVSYKTVLRYLDILEQAFLIRIVRPYLPNLRKRLSKAPKVYLRDSGLVHGLLNLPTLAQLLAHPVVGGSWEGYVVEQLVAALPVGTAFFHYRSATGNEIDFIAELPRGEVHAIEIKRTNAPRLSSILRAAFVDVGAERNFIVTPSSDRYPVGGDIEVIGLRTLIAEYLRIE